MPCSWLYLTLWPRMRDKCVCRDLLLDHLCLVWERAEHRVRLFGRFRTSTLVCNRQHTPQLDPFSWRELHTRKDYLTAIWIGLFSETASPPSPELSGKNRRRRSRVLSLSKTSCGLKESWLGFFFLLLAHLSPSVWHFGEQGIRLLFKTLRANAEVCDLCKNVLFSRTRCLVRGWNELS